MQVAQQQAILAEAALKGVRAGYSGKDKTMFISGEDKKVKDFIRVCNLKGKGHYPFRIAQSQVS